MANRQSKSKIRVEKHSRMCDCLVGTAEGPRLTVFRSSSHICAQIIDGTVSNTLAAASTVGKEVDVELKETNDKAVAAYVGAVIVRRTLEKGIKEVVFDRDDFTYQGKVQVLADTIREAGLDF